MKRGSKGPEAQPPKQWFSIVEVDRDMAKLKRRLDEVLALQTDKIQFDDARVRPLEEQISATIEDVFGTESREHRLHRRFTIAHSGPSMRPAWDTPGHVLHQQSQQNFERGIPEAAETLRSLIKRIGEKRLDFMRCPSCAFSSLTEYYCPHDGSVLVAFVFDQDAQTLEG
jgi:hypothetical protein